MEMSETPHVFYTRDDVIRASAFTPDCLQVGKSSVFQGHDMVAVLHLPYKWRPLAASCTVHTVTVFYIGDAVKEIICNETERETR